MMVLLYLQDIVQVHQVELQIEIHYGTDGKADVQYDELSQLEAGYKKRLKNGVLNLTGFMSNTEEGISNELNRTVGNPFKALGIEAETALAFGENFSFNGSLTWTKAEIDGGD